MRANRIAVFADLHYTRGSAKLKGSVLREALRMASARRVGAIVCAGDMLGTGTAAEAADLRALFDAQPLPVFFTPGNAERRTPSESAAADAILSNPSPLPDGLLLLDSSAGWAQLAEGLTAPSAALPDGQPSNHQTIKPSNFVGRDMGDGEKLAIPHIPPDEWGPTAPGAWREAVDSGAIGLTVAGHDHVDAVRDDGACRVLRGLDPDKAIGGPPSFATFVRDDAGTWRFEAAHEIAGVRPAEWSASFRASFLADLGLSTMYDPFGGLAFATDEHVPAVELRHASWRAADSRALGEALARWRAAGGRVLSLHLPELRFTPEGPQGIDTVCDACETARAIGCNRVTLHVPRISVSDFSALNQSDRSTSIKNAPLPQEEFSIFHSPFSIRVGGGPAAVTAAYAQSLAPLAGTGIAVGIENLHMVPGETEDARGYGYTPDECKALLEDLRQIDGVDIGFHLDIGHARNNAPYSTLFPIGSWYEQLGACCNGMHIHQVVMDEKGKMHNHKPLLGFFDKLISLASLVLARRDGLLPSAPMFLEVRDNQGPASLLALRQAIDAAAAASV